SPTFPSPTLPTRASPVMRSNPDVRRGGLLAASCLAPRLCDRGLSLVAVRQTASIAAFCPNPLLTGCRLRVIPLSENFPNLSGFVSQSSAGAPGGRRLVGRRAGFAEPTAKEARGGYAQIQLVGVGSARRLDDPRARNRLPVGQGGMDPGRRA